MTEKDFKELCPKLWADIQANLETYWFYNNSISLTTHSILQYHDFISKIENEKYMIHFKFSFERILIPQNLN